MKAAFNIKIFFILLFLTFLTSVFNSNTANALEPSGSIARINPECTGNAGGVITQPGTNDCEVTPDTQKVTWFRVEFCKSKPTGPTTTATEAVAILAQAVSPGAGERRLMRCASR